MKWPSIVGGIAFNPPVISVRAITTSGDLNAAFQGAAERFQIVTIDLGDSPAERAPLVGQRLQRRDRIHRTVDLRVIGIDHRDEAAHAIAVMGGEHRRFPNLSFLHFAVAEEREGARSSSARPAASA